jgi:hypothetical protein
LITVSMPAPRGHRREDRFAPTLLPVPILPMTLEHDRLRSPDLIRGLPEIAMPKMSAIDLKALLAAERYDALSAMAASKLSDERASALNYYMGDMSKDMPAPDGRSKAVSSDVADTIEGLMPPLMDIFAGGDEVVQFAPVGPEDVAAAEQETDYVNHVFMQQNPGFLVLYSFIKDALLSKIGVVKVWWECRQEVERETYLDQPNDAFALIVAQPNVEIVEHSEREIPPVARIGAGEAGGNPGAALRDGETTPGFAALNPGYEAAPRPKLHDVTIEIRRTKECARVEGVTPEEFGISRRARSIKDADYVFHDVFRTQSQLIAQGYDREQVKKLPSYTLSHTIEEQARDTVNESTLRQGDDGLNEASRLIRITEHYVRMDYDGSGEAALYRCTTAGEEGELLIRDGQPDVVREDVIPFAAMTPVIVTHRFFGRSIADLVMDIQRIKTALLRALLDNAYLANNPRTEVPETHATETTLDDLLISRPGGIVRTKQPGGLSVLKHPDIGGDVFPLLQYQDATREWRTGVSRQGQGVDPNALQNQVATIANQMFNASQAKVKLIARIFAETGIRDLFSLLHATIRKHGSQAQAVRLRNQWVTVDPRDWKARADMTINVGLGTGSKSEQLAHLQLIIGAQKEAIAAGLVSAKNLYHSAKELVKLAGHKNVDAFFTASGAPVNPTDRASAPLTPPADPKQVEIAAKAAAEKAKIETDAAHQKLKLEAQLAFEREKFALEKELKLLDLQIARERHQQDMAQSFAKTLVNGGVTPGSSPGGAPGGASGGPRSEAGAGGAPAEHPMLRPILELTEQLKRANAAKRSVRDAKGKPVGSEAAQ